MDEWTDPHKRNVVQSEKEGKFGHPAGTWMSLEYGLIPLT